MNDMMKGIIGKISAEHKKRRRALCALLVVSLFVAGGVSWQLRLTGITLSNDACCGIEEHQHTETCGETRTLICGYPENVEEQPGDAQPATEPHTHGDSCYEEQQVWLCGLSEGEEVPVHTHGDGCYEEQQVLSCGLPEHSHSDGCYETTQTLNCTEEHEHTDSCYTTEQVLVCGFDEHTHGEDCYTTENVLICNQPETEPHLHSEDCGYETKRALICEKEETAIVAETTSAETASDAEPPHVHTEDCYEITYVCGKEEHTHTILCYADHGADLETADDWERTLPDDLTGVWADDVIAVAQSQLGYQESERNFTLAEDEETIQGYTRYGEWYGNPYGDWCAMFVSFCLHYADIPEDAIPYASGCPSWVSKLDRIGLYTVAGDYVPAPGDLVFFAGEDSDEPDHVGIVTALDKDTYLNIDVLHTIEGNISDQVDERKHELPDETITGYVSMAAAYERAVELELIENEDTVPEKPVEYVNSEELTSLLNSFAVEADSYELACEANDPAASAEHMQAMEMLYTQAQAIFYELNPDADEAAFAGYVETNYLKAYSIYVGANQEPQTPPTETVTAAVAGTKDFQFENDSFIISLHLEGTVNLPVASDSAVDVPVNDVTDSNEVPMSGTEELVPGESVPSADAPTDESSEQTEANQTDDTSPVIPDGTSDLIETEKPVADEPPAVDEPSWADITMETAQVDESSETYAQFAAFAQEQGGEDEMFSLMAMRFVFIYDGYELDVSDCTLTAEITPKEPILTPPEQALPMMQAFSAASDEQPFHDDPAPEAEMGIVLAVLQEQDAKVVELDSVLLTKEDEIVPTLTVPLRADGILALAASQTANPKFTVQYYAYVDQVNTSGTNPLAIIDTSGGNLPQNGAALTMKNLYLENSGGRFYVATNKDTVVPVYSEKGFEYIQAPNLTYFNRLYENGHYALKEVWILNAGKSSSSTNKADWTVYTDPANLHFTNRQASVNDSTILINENAVIRLVFDTTASGYNNAAAFYDYDITDGKFYKAASLTGGTYAAQSDGVQVFGYTNKQGINSGGNYTGTGTKLAFGNMNTGTTLGTLKWNGQELNKYNETNRNTGGKGCTFGLVSHLDANGHIVYSGGVNAPALFNERTATGKTAFQNYSLDFKRDGDTYTLSAVNGTSAQNLDSFIHPQSYSIFTNNFWPMDSAPTYGAAGHDLKFGNNSLKNNRRYFDQYSSASYNQFPVSDDGPDHNSYFGMQYAVQFALTEDYIGPLEYYFFGDDDMWVFLDGELVCDIGGVHSSVGEYVNLWDYIQKGDAGSHTLSFFYTERGASGSSCYMRFTLPSVSSITPEQNTGTLRVEKEVTGPKTGNEVFDYEIHFTDAAGNNLKDDYSYTRYDREGNVVTTDVIIYDGGTFQLKDGEYIIVRYLPVGAKYYVTEVDPEPDIYKTTVSTNNGEPVAGREASGTIQLLTEEKVHYINQTFYELPETGGAGTILYTLGGLLLMAGALVFGGRRRRYERRAGR